MGKYKILQIFLRNPKILFDAFQIVGNILRIIKDRCHLQNQNKI